MEKHVKRRSLEELNLIDDFLFQATISHGKLGEEICRMMLSTILGRTIGRVKVSTQKVILGPDTAMRGIRMDAYVESEEEIPMRRSMTLSRIRHMKEIHYRGGQDSIRR